MGPATEFLDIELLPVDPFRTLAEEGHLPLASAICYSAPIDAYRLISQVKVRIATSNVAED